MMLLMNLWPKMAVHSTLTAITLCHIIPHNLLFSQPFESFNSHTSITTNTSQLKPNSQSPITYQSLPSSTSLNDYLDDTFNSTDSDFEMLQNPVYHSNSLSQFYSRVAYFPNFSFEPSPISQALPTQIRAPHSPYKLPALPSKDYNTSKLNINFPP